MPNKSPVFPISEPQHFSDYGFDPQIDYFQVLEEARRHKRETSSARSSSISPMDALHFKLQKPISKEDHFSKKKIKKNKKRWWKNALLFFRSKWALPSTSSTSSNDSDHDVLGGGCGVQCYHGRPNIRGSISGPIYITESRSGSSTPHRTTSRPSSGPLAGTLTPIEKDEVQIPYFSLREFDMDHHHQQHRVSTSAMPIYLVT